MHPSCYIMFCTNLFRFLQFFYEFLQHRKIYLYFCHEKTILTHLNILLGQLVVKIKKLDLSLYKILCCNLDAYVNSVFYGDSWAHVNYIAFLSPLWFEHDIKFVTISIFNLWRFQRFVTKNWAQIRACMGYLQICDENS